MERVPLILASGSPRRKEILERLKLDFTVITADVEEDSLEGETPEDSVRRLAMKKADAVAKKTVTRWSSGRIP